MFKFLMKALLQDKAEFVQLLMDNGADLTNFLDVRTLENLYLKTFCEKEKNAAAGVLNSVISKHAKTNDWYKQDLLWHVSVAIGKLLGDKQPAVYPKNDNGDVQYDNEPAHHVFLWAILLNKQRIGKLFWKLDKDHMGGALIAVKLLNSLAEEAKRGSDIPLQEDLKNHAKIYENYALGVLSECYHLDQDKTLKLLTRQLKNETTVFSLAESSTQMDFMAHTACHTKINKLWQGRMARQTSSDFQIILCIFLPFLVKTFNWRPPDDKSNELKSEKDRRNKSTPGKQQEGGKENGTSEKDHGNTSGSDVSLIDAFSMFFKTAKVKFYVHTISYVVFLALYSYFVLVSLQDTDRENWLSVEEFILWFWIITLMVEEFRQLWFKELPIDKRIVKYTDNKWNIFDTVVYGSFVLSVVLRFVLHGDNFVYARIFYCLTLIGFYIRFMQVFYMSKKIGPTVLMIQRMLYNLAFFVSIMLLFLVSYGIFAQAIRYPNSEASWSLLKDVLYMPYWQMYGELFLDDLEGNVIIDGINGTTIDCTQDPENVACPRSSPMVLVLFAFYMMISNVLLLNLLVAMFSYTFEQVQGSSEQVWRFYRYHLIQEYYFRPALPSPLIFINHLIRTYKYLYRKCQDDDKITNDFRVIYEVDAYRRLTEFERRGMETHLYNEHLRNSDRYCSRCKVIY